MKKKSEIRTILSQYKEKLELCKTDIAEVAMNIDIDVEERNQYLLKLQPTYTSYVAVVDVLEDILEVGSKEEQEDIDEE